MLNGYSNGSLTGAGSVLWKGREMYAAGTIDDNEFMDYVSRGYEMKPTPQTIECED